jgi:seryl-tRNA synthetase
LASIPNILDSSVPDGLQEHFNKVIDYSVLSTPVFAFENLPHYELTNLIDFESAVSLSGSRFVVLKGAVARLERALGQYMLDMHTLNHNYTEVCVPLLVNHNTMYGTGQLPKFEEELFQTTDGKFLIPTAEVPLTNLVANSFVENMPIRYCALTPCFRSEVGSAGKDVRGMFRQHQFNKVELVSIVEPSMSDEEHERMCKCVENILIGLELSYRKILLCAGDTGFSSAKTYDFEVWFPGQRMYREISSCSNMKDFQARRMNAKFKKDKAKDFVHTLNGSGVAIGRALIAILENHQKHDGKIRIPKALRPYLGNISELEIK